jgi:hypothetical protein
LFQKERNKLDEVFILYNNIINIILERISYYIDDEKQLYNDDFIYLLTKSYDWLYMLLEKFKDKKGKEETRVKCSESLEVHSKYIMKLIQIYPSYNNNYEELYGKRNTIVVFMVDKKKSALINVMKTKIIQVFVVIIQALSFENKEKNERYINKKELIDLVYIIIDLIIVDFKEIINNKNKYNDLLNFLEAKDNNNDYIKEINMLVYIIFLIINILD